MQAIFKIILIFSITSSVTAAQCNDWVRDDVRTLDKFSLNLKQCSDMQPENSKDIQVLERMSNCDLLAAQTAQEEFCTPALKETWKVLKFLFSEKLKLNVMLVRNELPYMEHERLSGVITKMQLQEIQNGQRLANQQLDQIDAAASAAYAKAKANQKIQDGFRVLKLQNSVEMSQRWITVTDRNGNSIGRIDNGGGFNSQGGFYSNGGQYQGVVDTGGGFNSHGSVYDKNGNYLGKISSK